MFVPNWITVLHKELGFFIGAEGTRQIFEETEGQSKASATKPTRRKEEAKRRSKTMSPLLGMTPLTMRRRTRVGRKLTVWMSCGRSWRGRRLPSASSRATHPQVLGYGSDHPRTTLRQAEALSLLPLLLHSRRPMPLQLVLLVVLPWESERPDSRRDPPSCHYELGHCRTKIPWCSLVLSEEFETPRNTTGDESSYLSLFNLSC